MALALENGRLGTLFDGAATTSASVTSLTDSRSPSSVSDSIRVFALDPSIGATVVEESLSRFDVWSKTGVFWNRTDQANRFLTPLDPFQELTNRNKLDNMDFSTGLYRRLPTGGFAGLSILNNFQDNTLTTNGSQVLNPANRPRVDFTFEQPLWQGAGVLINQTGIYTRAACARHSPMSAGSGILLVHHPARNNWSSNGRFTSWFIVSKKRAVTLRGLLGLVQQRERHERAHAAGKCQARSTPRAWPSKTSP